MHLYLNRIIWAVVSLAWLGCAMDTAELGAAEDPLSLELYVDSPRELAQCFFVPEDPRLDSTELPESVACVPFEAVIDAGECRRFCDDLAECGGLETGAVAVGLEHCVAGCVELLETEQACGWTEDDEPDDACPGELISRDPCRDGDHRAELARADNAIREAERRRASVRAERVRQRAEEAAVAEYIEQLERALPHAGRVQEIEILRELDRLRTTVRRLQGNRINQLRWLARINREIRDLRRARRRVIRSCGRCHRGVPLYPGGAQRK